MRNPYIGGILALGLLVVVCSIVRGRVQTAQDHSLGGRIHAVDELRGRGRLGRRRRSNAAEACCGHLAPLVRFVRIRGQVAGEPICELEAEGVRHRRFDQC